MLSGNKLNYVPAVLNGLQDSLQLLQTSQQTSTSEGGACINSVESNLRMMYGNLKVVDERFRPADTSIGEFKKSMTLHFEDTVNVLRSIQD